MCVAYEWPPYCVAKVKVGFTSHVSRIHIRIVCRRNPDRITSVSGQKTKLNNNIVYQYIAVCALHVGAYNIAGGCTLACMQRLAARVRISSDQVSKSVCVRACVRACARACARARACVHACVRIVNDL